MKRGPKEGSGPINNISGKTYGYLIVVSIIGRTSARDVIWECQCVCGKFVERTGRSLKKGFKCSCGCMRGILQKNNNDVKGMDFYGQYMRIYKKGADDRELVWELSKEDFITIVTSNCYYCGATPTKREIWARSGLMNGIDRMERAKGYTLSNSVPCCTKCNYMKGRLNTNEFIEQTKRIVLYMAPLSKEDLTDIT